MRSSILGGILCLTALAGEAAHAATAVQTARFSNYSVDDGLSQSSVTALLQDEQGYIWIATEDGLNRFDGYEFLQFGLASAERVGLAGGIAVIREGRDGRIWIGTFSSGLYWLDPLSGLMTHCGSDPGSVPPGLASRVRSLAVDTGGAVWAVGMEAAYRQTSDCSFEAVSAVDGSSSFNLVAKTQSADGTVWLWTEDGDLWRSETSGTGLERVRTFADLGLESTMIWAIAGSESDTWVAFDSSDLFRLNQAGDIVERFTIPAATSADARIRAIHLAPDGELWVAGLGIGLARVRPGVGVVATWRHDGADPTSLVHNDTTSLLADRSGGLWIGTRSHGLSRLQIIPEGIAHYRHSSNNPDSIANNMVTAFAERSSDEHIWVGSDGGGLDLVELGVGMVGHFAHAPADPDSLSSDRVWALHEDRSGRLWVGTWFGGLSVLEPQTDKFVRYPSASNAKDPAIRTVLSIAESGDGTLWFGTMSDGLFRLSPGADRIEQVAAGNRTTNLGSAKISALLVDSLDRLWVGTWDKGVISYDRKLESLTSFRKLPDGSGGLPHDTVRAIAEAPDGAIWIGTLNGLSRIDPVSAAVTSFGVESGLPPGTIYAIVADDDALWISSNRGIGRFDPATRSTQRFDPADGLQGFEFNGGAALKTRQGRLLFGGTQGFNAFHPDRVRNNPFPPQVAITRVTVQDGRFERPTRTGAAVHSTVEFAHDQNRISFEFAGLHYASPQRILYAYRLEGLQDEWLPTTASRRIATYANLAPGSYRFQVRAANKDGLWSEQDAAFAFAVASPWWRTPTAYAVYAFAAAIVVFGVVQWRTLFLRRRAALLKARVSEGTRQIARQKKTIEKQATNLQALLETKEKLFARVSHEFRTPLTLILGPLDRMRAKASGQDAESLSLIQRNARRLLRLVEQLLDLARLSGERPLQLEAIALEPFLSAHVGAFRSLAETKGISLALTIASRSTVDASPEVLEAALTNLIGNALKFTPAGGQVDVYLGEEGGEAILRVSDDGPGIEPGREKQIFQPFERGDSRVPGTGIGLAVVRESVKALGGDVRVSRAATGGAEFTVTLPLSCAEAESRAEFSPVERSIDVSIADEVEDPVTFSDATDDDERPHVLVIEDHADLRRYIGECLQDDFDCMLVADGESGVRHAIKDIPDLVLSDVMLPGIDGFEITHTLRHDERTSHIPIVLLTAMEDRESLFRGLSEKADEYLTKPFDAEELTLRLHNLIEVRHIMRRQAAAEWRAAPLETDASAPIAVRYGPRDQAFLDKLNGLLADHYSDNAFGVGQMASGVAMSNRQLLRKLRALLDTRPADYLRDFRLQQAASMLTSGKPIGVIAQDCGFATQAHFGQCFKARFGVTPGEYAAGAIPT